MSTKITGDEPVYPVTNTEKKSTSDFMNKEHVYGDVSSKGGLTLRLYLIGQALISTSAGVGIDPPSGQIFGADTAAKLAIAIADETIKQLNHDGQ